MVLFCCWAKQVAGHNIVVTQEDMNLEERSVIDLMVQHQKARKRSLIFCEISIVFDSYVFSFCSDRYLLFTQKKGKDSYSLWEMSIILDLVEHKFLPLKNTFSSTNKSTKQRYRPFEETEPWIAGQKSHLENTKFDGSQFNTNLT